MNALNQSANFSLAALLPEAGATTATTSVQATVIWAVLSVAVASAFYSAYLFLRQPASSSGRVPALGTVAAVLLYCYLADRTNLFRKSAKVTDESTFIWLCLLALGSGVATMRRNACPAKSTNGQARDEGTLDLLPRQQTEEWKGWMQIAILLYHYCGMSQVLHVYRVMRILVGSYLFLTGYGHTIYFLRTNDFSLHRVVGVLTRLNLLAAVLPFMMGSKYDLYYFPALSTFWFLITWAVVPRSSGPPPWRTVLTRVLLAIFSLELLLRMPAIWYSCAHVIRIAKGADIDTKEFLFRLSLDRFVPYVGIIVACANEHLRRSLQPVSWPPPLVRPPIVVMAGCVCFLAPYFLFSSTLNSKEASNRSHPVTEAVAILAFVMLRNSHRSLRTYHSRLFAWVGRYSLETYVLQYHIWLADDARKILSIAWCGTAALSPVAGGKCWMERLLITGCFLGASYLAGRSTATLTAGLVGPKKAACSTRSLLSPVLNHDATMVGRRSFQVGPGQRFMLVLLFLWFVNAMW